MDTSDQPINTIRFYCPKPCRNKFNAIPDEAADDVESDYFATCNLCGKKAPQAPWDKALMASIGKHTGPITDAGKAASAANLAGHPTAEESKITRFNAITHGLSAKVATFFPARPGSYTQCNGCEHLTGENCVEYNACLKRHDLFLRVHAAFESGNPKPLKELVAQTNSGIIALIQDMIFTIAADGGPQLISPEWFSDKDGGFHLAEGPSEQTGELVKIYKHQAHPLLRPLIDYISKANLTLSDQSLTPKQQGESDTLKGFLDNKATDKESTESHRQKQLEALDGLRGMMQRGQAKLAKDEVLAEYKQVEDGS